MAGHSGDFAKAQGLKQMLMLQMLGGYREMDPRVLPILRGEQNLLSYTTGLEHQPILGGATDVVTPEGDKISIGKSGPPYFSDMSRRTTYNSGRYFLDRSMMLSRILQELLREYPPFIDDPETFRGM